MIEPAGVEIFEHNETQEKLDNRGRIGKRQRKKKHVGPAEPGGNYSLNRA